MSHNSEVIAMYSETAKQYGLTLDQFLAEIKSGQIKIVRKGSEITFEREEPVFELNGESPAKSSLTRQSKKGGRDYPD